ncbi:MAG: PEP/pyruvate-binding domain-containing protein, partial [Candidatus Eisenbacteria bacterium]|nr:PEP/pyruvate-binding domain-containing protein [Candidatus Eisenbacteria bacterium]
MTKYVYSFGQGKPEGDPKRRDLLGGKGAGLAEMTALGLPVPPGFTITTEACNDYQVQKDFPGDLRAQVSASLASLESYLGRTFGDVEKPLLVSVRSGARASMPGMMDTILNLGLNDATLEGMARSTGNRRFALDSYRRFISMFSGVALGVKKELFDHALDEVRREVAKEKGLPAARFGGEQLQRSVPDSDIPEDRLERAVAAFKQIVLKETGKPFPQDPGEQLWGAISAVFASWNNPRAIVYRKMYDIPDDWGCLLYTSPSPRDS